MQQVSKDRVLAAIVRTFFKYFITGVIESQHGEASPERYEPRCVKQTMLNYYEKIAPAFNNEAFYSIFRMNYDEEELESVLSENITSTTSLMDLVRLVCRTDEFYSAMVSEYKRNFELLLCGRIAIHDEYERDYARCPSAGCMDADKAESIINRMASNAYECGRNAITPVQD